MVAEPIQKPWRPGKFQLGCYGGAGWVVACRAHQFSNRIRLQANIRVQDQEKFASGMADTRIDCTGKAAASFLKIDLEGFLVLAEPETDILTGSIIDDNDLQGCVSLRGQG